MVYQYYLEIKNRCFLLFLTWFFTFLICYIYKEILLFLCITKVNSLISNNTMLYFIFTDVKEVFSVYFQLILFVSHQIFVFFFIFHFFSFISLGLYKFEYNYLRLIFYSTTICWFILFLLFNNILLPLSWNFFLSFQALTSFNLHFEAKLTEYVEFYISFYYFCTVYCQIFVFVFVFFDYINTNLNFIRKFRKFVHYFFIFLSTLLTPPDIISQVVFSLILLLVYEILIFLNIIKYFVKKQKYKTI